MKTWKRKMLNQFLAVLLLTSGSIVAQTQQKVKKSYPVTSNASINVDAQHTKVIFETWNKNELEIEAFLDTKGLSKEEITDALAKWQVGVKGDRNQMNLSSSGGGFGPMPKFPGLDSLHQITSIMGPLMNDLVGPMVQKFSEHPPLPPKFMENMGTIKFDHEAYKKDGEKYLKKWEKEVESKFGPEYEASMEKWAKNFEKDAEKWSAKMEVEMNAWSEKYGEDMEKWADKFGKDMEAWGEEFGKEMEVWAKQFEGSETGQGIRKNVNISNSSENKTRKTMIVRLPKDVKLTLNVRYGEVRLADRTTDLKGHISHSRLAANTIDGNNTMLEVSYSPITIRSWLYGVLKTNYVQNASIDNVKSLKLTSASSNVKIGEIGETAVISGTFGNLDILKLAPDFKSLDISLENSELNLNIPETALNFNYIGSQSKIDYPSSITAKPVKSYDSELINGYQKTANGTGIVVIKARYSDVTVE